MTSISYIFKKYILFSMCFILLFYFINHSEAANTSFVSLVRLGSYCLFTIFCFLYFRGSTYLSSVYFFLVVIFFISFFIVLALLSYVSFRVFVNLVVFLNSAIICFLAIRNHSFRCFLISLLDALIYISGAALIAHILLISILNQSIDIHSFIFPWSKARYEDYSFFIRTGGLYLEPGTYGNWVYSFFFFRLLLSNSVPKMLMVIVSLTMILTFSVWSILVGGFLVLVSLLAMNIALKHKLLLSMLFIAVLVGVLLYLNLDAVFEFVDQKLTSSGSRSVRDVALNEFLLLFSQLIFIGIGYSDQFCVNCRSPQDVGVLIIFIVNYGFAFTILTWGSVLYSSFRTHGLGICVLSIPVMTSKLFYNEPVIWLIICYSIFMIFVNKLEVLRVNQRVAAG